MAKKKAVKAVTAPAQPAGVKMVSGIETIHAPATPEIHGLMPVAGNIVGAGAASVIWAGNDCTLVFSRPRPAMSPDGNAAKVALAEVVAIIQLSAATMKDLSLVVSEAVGKYEEKYGTIETLYTKARQAKKRSSTKH